MRNQDITEAKVFKMVDNTPPYLWSGSKILIENATRKSDNFYP